MKLFYVLLLGIFSLSARADWKNESEAGIIITSGNTKTQSLNAKTTTDYLWDKNTVRANATFLKAKQSGVESAYNWAFGLRYEREMSSMFSVFLAQSVEGDKYAGLLQRYNTDLGGKYFFFKKEKDFTWFAEAGYRYTNEHTSNGVKKGMQKARIYTEAEKYWSESVTSKLWAEYIPNFTVSDGWLANGEASIAAAMTSIFSLKSAYLVKYNNAPGAEYVKTDNSFTTSLVAKF